MSDTGIESKPRSINVLLVDDDEGDIVLVERALESQKCVPRTYVVKDGVEAMWFLRRQGEFANAPRPDLILLDLNMPRKDGREVLVEIKQDSQLRSIPVVVLTTSSSAEDIRSMYSQHANCYVTKPNALQDFTATIQEIKTFWTAVAGLPPPLLQRQVEPLPALPRVVDTIPPGSFPS
jgi:two-component system response regulator